MKNLAKALLNAQKSMGVALKDAKNPFFKSKYADLNAVIDAAIPTLNENGIVVAQPTVIKDGKQYVETKLIHADSGEELSGFTEIVVKSATDAQQVGSGISYARRYGLQSLVVLKADDNDAETAVGRGTALASTSNITITTISPTAPKKIETITSAAPSKKFEIKRPKAEVSASDDI